MLRKGLLPELPPELQDMAGEYNISLVSPLATAQRSVALQGINSFMAFLGQAAQFDQSILDNINPDEAAREHANISGVHYGVLRTAEEVQQIRTQRAQAQAAEKQKQEQMAMMGMKSQLDKEQAETQKIQSEAGVNLIEGQEAATQLGM